MEVQPGHEQVRVPETAGRNTLKLACCAERLDEGVAGVWRRKTSLWNELGEIPTECPWIKNRSEGLQSRHHALGKKRARVVTCGNMIQRCQDGSHPRAKVDNYAGGVDGTVLRCLFRKSAEEAWTIAATDVHAVLLAPKRDSQLMVGVPPRALVDAKVVPESERWIV